LDAWPLLAAFWLPIIEFVFCGIVLAFVCYWKGQYGGRGVARQYTPLHGGVMG